jgi:hypothetical protein
MSQDEKKAKDKALPSRKSRYLPRRSFIKAVIASLFAFVPATAGLLKAPPVYAWDSCSYPEYMNCATWWDYDVCVDHNLADVWHKFCWDKVTFEFCYHLEVWYWKGCC